MEFRKYTYIVFCLLFLVIGSLAFTLDLGALKYVRFLTPLLLFMMPLFIKSGPLPINYSVKQFSKKVISIFTLVAVITVFSNLFIFSLGFTYRNFVNIVFLLSPIISCYIIVNKLDEFHLNKILFFLFYAFVFSYVIELVKDGASLSSIVNTIVSSSLTNSESETESGRSLIFGFFALFFLAKKKYKLMIFSVFLVILGAKRIAIAGTAVAIAVYFFYPFLSRLFLKKNVRVFAGMVTLFLFGLANLWTFVFSGKYDRMINNLTGISPNEFFMGRLNRIETFFSSLRDKDNFLIGYGTGYVENVLYYYMNLPTPFHNDFYRLFLEFGPIIFIWWCYIMIKFSAKNALSFSCFVLLIILMQTDNILIYETVMYSYYIIILFSFKAIKTGKAAQKQSRDYIKPRQLEVKNL